MKEVIPIEYQCEICETLYSTPQEALDCENKSVRDDGINVGDTVLFNYGLFGSDRERARVISKHIIGNDWPCTHIRQKLWHTALLTVVPFCDEGGEMELFYGEYEKALCL